MTVDQNVAALVPTPSAAEGGSRIAGGRSELQVSRSQPTASVLLSSIVTTMCIIRHNRHLNRYANKNYGKIWPPSPFSRFYTQMSPYPFTINTKPFCITSNTKSLIHNIWDAVLCSCNIIYTICNHRLSYPFTWGRWFISTYLHEVRAILIRKVWL